ncbi:MAG: Flp pilus assembly complex ATPase component TadA [Phycisphaeraceae bacterium]|nr:Flp pilus assembly complex ATPase component TadA [Phycisphaeraceae bacterium]
MEFQVHDHSTNTRIVVHADGDVIVIGRDERCGLRLKSPFVARRHAQIVRRGNQLFVEALSRAGTTVANRQLSIERPTKLDFGDEIQIGPFTVAAIGRDRRTARADELAQLQARLMDFEKQVHAELLERMNLRVTGRLNKSDATFVRQCLTQLDQIVQQKMSDLPEPVVAHTLRTHLHRLVIAEVVRQCQGRVSTEYRDVDPALLDRDQERKISELVSAMVDLMPLLFDPASVGEDLSVAEEAFDDLFDQHYKQTPADLRQYIVRRTVSKDIADILLGLGPLQDLLEMPSVSEIMVVGKDHIYIEKSGVIQPTTRSFFSDEVLMSIIERILTPVGRRVDTSTPLVDARLADGSRVNVVISPLSLVGPCVTIRKFGWVPFTMDDLIERGSISEQCAAFLQGCVVGRKNIVISGGTGSGKTTLLNVVAAYARPAERILTVEESAELKLPQPHVVSLEGRPANVEGRGAYTIRDLVRNALRMRPDRIIVGEVRGPEALDMLQAMNTGHDGSLTTLHANNPQDAAHRLETLVLMAVDMPMRAIREQIVTAVDLIVQVARYADGRRRVTHITEITGIDPDLGQVRMEDIFKLTDPDQPRLRHTGYIPTFAEALVEKKFIDVGVFL